jgi:hypothetical protein
LTTGVTIYAVCLVVLAAVFVIRVLRIRARRQPVRDED